MEQMGSDFARQLEEDRAAREPAEKLYQSIRDKLTAAGFTQNAADVNASLLAARYATRALPAVPRPAPPPPHAARPMRVRAAAPPPPAPAAEVYRQTPMTDTELRDWKRRNAEAMKILEKTTPELP